jgi:hypothetical protein
MIKHKSNQPLLDELTDAQRAAVIDGADALAHINSFEVIRFDKWMTVARGVAPLCDLADRPGMSRKARKSLLADNGYKTLNEATVSRLRLMAKHETAVRIWRDGLTPRQRESWNSPSSICNRCPAVRKAIAEANAKRPPRTRRTTNPTVAFEKALDVISDCLAATEDDDARQVMLERIGSMVQPYCFPEVKQPAPEPTPKPARKRKAKTEAKPEPKADGGLAWQDLGPHSMWSDARGWSAKTPLGEYRLIPVDTSNGSTTYEVKLGDQLLASRTRTAAKAKLIAQRHYDAN